MNWHEEGVLPLFFYLLLYYDVVLPAVLKIKWKKERKKREEEGGNIEMELHQLP